MTRLVSFLSILLTAAALGASATAQPPRGPRDVIEGAREQAEDARREEAMGTAADQAPPVEAPTPQSIEERRARTAAHRMAGRTPPIAQATQRPDLPAGTIEVEVVDGDGQPLAEVPVRVGIMKQGGARDALMGNTDARGVVRFTDQPTGSDQAYRVSVDHQGARYGAPPFRLETDHGHGVRIRRLPTTTNTRMLLLVLGQTMLEYRDGRIHVTEQAQIANLGDGTVVFGDGLHYPLPSGFMAFQSPAQMTDQRVVPQDDGFLLKGSLPPGNVTLNWAYDVPLDGAEARIAHDIPFTTYAYRVMTDANAEMRLEVEGLDRAQVVTQQGRRMLVTQLERSPQDPPFGRLVIDVKGIPTPGPLRFVALGGALLLLILGLLLVTRGGRREQVLVEAREERKREILDAAVDLGEAHARGEVGPKYHARRMGELVDELASLLHLEDASAALEKTDKSSEKPKDSKRPRNQHRSSSRSR